ncbi:ABC transporter permease [Candidatus Saccharibacteria bacterium]|nr:ABC transporter permease [Candidatus Saccharibacteria bacterium]
MNLKNIQKNLLPIWVYVPVDIKRLFRSKVSIFFVFLFPLMFLFVFGSIFRNDSNVSFRVALVNQSESDFARQFSNSLRNNQILKVDNQTNSIDQAKEKMNRGQIDATIILPSGFGDVSGDTAYPTGEAVILYEQSSESASVALKSVMEGILKEVNSDFVETDVPFVVKSESTATEGLRQFDYTFTGIMGFTLLSLGVYGPTSVFPRMKQRGVLRRYQLTTLKVWQYFVGNVLSNAFIGILSVATMFVSAVVFFELNMRGNYLNLAVVVILGTMLLYGIGLAIGGWARTENQAAPLAQMITLPMMFLSGVFFPVFLMPEFLQNITKFIPLTPIIEALRLIVTENASLLDLGSQLGIIGGWIVIVYVLAFRVFRWE